MPRIASTEIDRIKDEVSLLDWVKSEGLSVRKRGKDFVLLCPFHEEDTESCVITPSKNLWNCFGCGCGGTIIDWVMKRRSVSFPHAIEVIKTKSSGPVPVNNYNPQHIEPLMPMDVSGQIALKEVIDFYHSCLKESPEVQSYLKKRGLYHPDLIREFKLGYCNRTLGYRLPSKNSKAGKTIRQTLRGMGIYRDTMFEHFGGCLVVPIIDENGQVLEVYGRKIRPDNKISKTEMKHGYLPGPHKGIWNERVFKTCDEIILCEALIDAMTFWVHGFKNVTCIYGTSGFSDDLKHAFENWTRNRSPKINPTETQSSTDKLIDKPKRVFIAFDMDDAGNKACDKYKNWFGDRGIEVRRVTFPSGMDANAYALKVQPPVKALDHLLRNSELITSPRSTPDTQTSLDDGSIKDVETTSLGTPDDAREQTQDPQLKQSDQKPVLTLVVDRDKVPRTDLVLVEDEGQIHIKIQDRSYRIRGLEKNLSYGALKINLMVSVNDLFHVDTIDLYQARQRSGFIHQGSVELGLSEEKIKRDLGLILLKLEEVQTDRIQKTLEVKPPDEVMDEKQKLKALTYLKSPDLVQNILSDFGKLGVVGEDTNVLTGYLAATSRKLDKPLAVIIQSSSAAGKSSLMEAVLTLIPEEERVQYSALTGQSLFYMGETNLKHKILAIAEEEGASNASYALKLLQSEGVITIASTGKDDATGQLVTKEYRVEGPVMLFLTTTAIDIDEELLNRCMVLTVNETQGQTKAIHDLQRQRQTLEGLLMDLDRSEITDLHRNVQRLLKPLKVINPYAQTLSFASNQTRTRRDHMKYLGLISSIALLHQHSRQVKQVTHSGKIISYVEVTSSDIDLANQLSSEVLGRTLDELPPQTRKLLVQLREWIKEKSVVEQVPLRDIHFKRKQARDELGWSDTPLKVHLKRLVEMEYLSLHRSSGLGGIHFEYALVYEGLEGVSINLKNPTQKPDPEPPDMNNKS